MGRKVIRGGFTLIELLISAMIFAVVLSVISACVFAGIRVWDYARKCGGVEGDALMKLEIVQRDVANTFRFYAVPFAGTVNDMSFAGLVETTGDVSQPARIGTVHYYFDTQRKGLFRKVWAFPGSEPTDVQPEKLLAGLSDFKISYYAPPSDRGGDVWQEGWNDETNIPGAVTVELTFEGEAPPLKMKRTILIPASTPLPEDEPPKDKDKKPPFGGGPGPDGGHGPGSGHEPPMMPGAGPGPGRPQQ